MSRLVDTGFIDPKQADFALSEVAGYASSNGFIPLSLRRKLGASSFFPRKERRSIVEKYFRFIASGPRTRDELSEYIRNLGIHPHNIQNWAKMLKGRQALSKHQYANSRCHLVLGYIRKHKRLTANQLVGLTGIDKWQTRNSIARLKANGAIVSAKGTKPQAYECAKTYTKPTKRAKAKSKHS